MDYIISAVLYRASTHVEWTIDDDDNDREEEINDKYEYQYRKYDTDKRQLPIPKDRQSLAPLEHQPLGYSQVHT